MRKQARHGEKGAELIEMAFVILLFLVLMIGVFEFGRAYNIYQNITNAAREGARFAVAPQRGERSTTQTIRKSAVLSTASCKAPTSTPLQPRSTSN